MQDGHGSRAPIDPAVGFVLALRPLACGAREGLASRRTQHFAVVVTIFLPWGGVSVPLEVAQSTTYVGWATSPIHSVKVPLSDSKKKWPPLSELRGNCKRTFACFPIKSPLQAEPRKLFGERFDLALWRNQSD
jgi:hypothetical protein